MVPSFLYQNCLLSTEIRKECLGKNTAENYAKKNPDCYLGSVKIMKRKLYLSKWIISTEISAGEMPLMREACPMVAGRILASFSFASLESALICL